MNAVLSENDAQFEELEDFLVKLFGDNFRDLAKADISDFFRSNCDASFLIYRNPADKKIIATAAIAKQTVETKHWGISWVGVDPEHRGKGLGLSLIKDCLKKIAAQSDGSYSAELAAYPENTALYEKVGFKSVWSANEMYHMIKVVKDYADITNVSIIMPKPVVA